MKYTRKKSGFSQLRKPPSRKLRKAIENFIRRYGAGDRAAAKNKAQEIIWTRCPPLRGQVKGVQHTLCFSTTSVRGDIPDINEGDLVIGYRVNGVCQVDAVVGSLMG